MTHTPQKYVTLSFDDGITQDRRLIGILRHYGFYACSFNINTGLFGADWQWVGPAQFGRDDVTHIRFTEAEITSGLYDGFNIEVHTLHHPCLCELSDEEVTAEVNEDAANIESLFGVHPLGLAWPGGDDLFTDQNIRTVLDTTDIRYGRCTTPTHNFEFPACFMRWYPTCSISDPACSELIERFIEEPADHDELLYIWGHAYELDGRDLWETFETQIARLSEAVAAGQITPITTRDFYLRYRNQVPTLAYEEQSADR